jgi:trk system potassium uptake protein TrkA
MYIIVAGGGIIGSHIAALLADEEHEVVVLEQSKEALENIRRQLDVKTIQGNSATPTILKQAEAERADLVLAVTNNDETNMITCFMAKELGAGTTAARIRNPEYSGYFVAQAKSPTATRKIVRPKKLGIDVFINPEAEAAREIMGILSSFYSSPVENFADGAVQIREFRVEDDALINRSLSTIEFPKPCVIAAIIREGEIIAPDDNEIVVLGDSVHLVAAREDMDELGGMFSTPKRPARKVVIVGGGQIGFLTAEGLHRQGVLVKVIDSDLENCKQIATKLEQITVLQGDATDRSFLVEQGVPAADALIAATESDELNILCGLLAKTLGVPRSLVVINRPGYIPLAEAIGVDIAALPTLLTADKISRFVLHGGVLATALLEGQQLEAIEFVTSPTASIANKKLADAGLPKESVVGAIVRNSSVIIPPGEEEILPGDHVIVVAPLAAVHSLEKLFQ